MARSSYSGEEGFNPKQSILELEDAYGEVIKYYYGNAEAAEKKFQQLCKQERFKTLEEAYQREHQSALQTFSLRKKELQDEHKKTIEAINLQYAVDIQKYKGNAKKLQELEIQHDKALKNADEELAKNEKNLQQDVFKNAEELDRQLTELKIDNQQLAYETAEKLNVVLYNKMSASQRLLADKEEITDRKNTLKKLNNSKIYQEAELESLDNQLSKKQELLAAEPDLSKKKIIESDIAELENQKTELLREQETTTLHIEEIQKGLSEAESRREELNGVLLRSQLSYLDIKGKEEVLNEYILEQTEKQAKLRQEMADIIADGGSESDLTDKMDALAKSMEEVQKASDLLTKAYNTESTMNDMKDEKLNSQLSDAKATGRELKLDNETKKALLGGSAKAAKKDPDKASTADKLRLQNKENRAAQRESEKLDEKEKAKQANEDFGPLLKESLKSQASAAAAMKAGFKMLDDLAKSIDTNIESFYQYQGHIEARLQGSESSFKSVAKSIDKNVGFSGLLSQKEMVNSIKELTDHGVAYNIETRAFLATVSENIANTFDAFDASLLRMIRIQQADTTAARLGMEASLTKLFNQYFSDTSYLTDAFDSVSGAILDASSQMTRDASMEFEYIVQKWLGALYSIGLSQDTVNTIAEGINYLGTGNVEALNNNDALRTLLAMSASQAGMDFGQILIDGIDADTTNELLKSMITYLSQISSNTQNNQVTKAVYSELFGMNTTDLKVFSHLQQSELDQLYKNTQSYNDSWNEVNNQLSQVASRIHISQIIDTAFENIMVDAATNIGGNVGTYGLWKTLNIIEGLTGGIQIPAFAVMGNMVDLDTTITALAKAGIAGLSLMSSVLGGLFSGQMFGTLDLKKWGFDDYTSRGASTTQILKGMQSGVSSSSEFNTVGSANAGDIKSTSMTDAANGANEDKEITNKDVEGIGQSELQHIMDAVWESENVTVLSELTAIKNRLNDPFKVEMEMLNGLYNKIWRVKARILNATDPWGSTEAPAEEPAAPNTETPSGSTGQGESPSEEIVTIVQLNNDSLDALQEKLIGNTYKVEVTNGEDLKLATPLEISLTADAISNPIVQALSTMQSSLLAGTYKADLSNLSVNINVPESNKESISLIIETSEPNNDLETAIEATLLSTQEALLNHTFKTTLENISDLLPQVNLMSELVGSSVENTEGLSLEELLITPLTGSIESLKASLLAHTYLTKLTGESITLESGDTIVDPEIIVETPEENEAVENVLKISSDPYFREIFDTILNNTFKVQLQEGLPSTTLGEDTDTGDVTNKNLIDPSLSPYISTVDYLYEKIKDTTFKAEIVNFDAITNAILNQPLSTTPSNIPSNNETLLSQLLETNNNLRDYLSETITIMGTENTLEQVLSSHNAVNEKQLSELVNVFNQVQESSFTSTHKDTVAQLLEKQFNENNTEKETLEPQTLTETLIYNTDALETLLTLLSLDRVFKVENTNSETTSDTLTQLTTFADSINTSIVTSLENDLQLSQTVASINDLHTQIQDVKNAVEVAHTSPNKSVTVDSLSDDVKAYLNNTIKSMIIAALTDKVLQEATTPEPTESIQEQIQKALALMNVNVTVTNDFFTEFLQKNAFSN